MSGHSKWHNIRRKKEANDAKKGKIFSKMSRLITVAARQGGGDPRANPTLRLAVDKAKASKMPKDNIERAIKRGTGELAGENFEEVMYEGYGPEGVALLVKGLTDNKNRIVAEVRQLFDKSGGSLGALGSTVHIFGADPENPTFEIELTDADKVKKVVALIDSLEDNDDIQEVYANFTVPEELEDQL
jgi:YebC/PmpR family DNA-binding regulatory protein